MEALLPELASSVTSVARFDFVIDDKLVSVHFQRSKSFDLYCGCEATACDDFTNHH